MSVAKSLSMRRLEPPKLGSQRRLGAYCTIVLSDAAGAFSLRPPIGCRYDPHKLQGRTAIVAAILERAQAEASNRLTPGAFLRCVHLQGWLRDV